MQELLDQLKIKADVIKTEQTDFMIKYFVQLRPGELVANIDKYSSEIALGMKSYSMPLTKLIPEEGLISIELLKAKPSIIDFNNLSCHLVDSDPKKLRVILGKSHEGADIIYDLTKAPHILLAGTTGSGKSVMLHSIICSLLFNPNIKLALIDPKNVEFNYYRDVRQLLYPISNDSTSALDIMSDLVYEMENRFKKISKGRANSIQSFNAKKVKKIPYIVLVIDEFADLMQTSKKEFQFDLNRLAQKARACGIHIIIATQRPSVDVITGTIKANFPTRISCKVTSATNSRVILEQSGAEKLLGKGDAILSSGGNDMVRFQGAFVDEKTITSLSIKNERNSFYKFLNTLRRI